MASRFWVGGTGTWDGSSTTHWATSSGGGSGASAPTSSDDVTIDANSGGGTITIASGAVCNNLTITWTAATTNAFTLQVNFAPGGTVSINGNSGANRPIFQSSVLGTQRTLTIGTLSSMSNVDFQDIAGAGAAAPFSGSGGVGNGLGCSGVTFTSPVTRYWVAVGGGNWSATSSWSASSGGASGASVPLPQDTVVFNASSITSVGRTITVDMPRIGKDITFNGLANNPNFQRAINYAVFGTFDFTGGSVTMNGGGICALRGRSSHNFVPPSTTVATRIACAAPGGTYTLQGAFTSDSARDIDLSDGTLDFNGFSVTTGAIFPSLDPNNAASTRTRVLSLGASLIILLATVTVWDASAPSGLTVNPGSSTIKLTDASSSDKTFAGGGLAYNNIWLSGAGTGKFIFTGSNTFNDFKADTPPHTIQFTAGTTTTVTSWSVRGTAGNLFTIGSVTAASHALAKAGGGQIGSDYLSISRSDASPGSTWYAGANSTNGGNNTGWIFSAAGYVLTGAAGSFTETGKPATFLYNRVLHGDAGAFLETGQAANLIVVRKLLSDPRYVIRVGRFFAVRTSRDFQASTSRRFAAVKEL